MQLPFDGMLTVLLIGAVIYNAIIYKRYKEQQIAFQKCMSLTDKFHTIGEMAASVTHEIRNPLTTIHGYLQLFARKQEFSPYKGQMNLLLTELDRANLLIQEYLLLCKDHTADFKPTQLNDVIRSLFPLLEAQANSACQQIELRLADIPETQLDDKEIRQLILNLARNGLEAMQQGQTLVIETAENRETGTLTLSISDDGPGIPPHVLRHLGKPFLSTKENGTGLGLAVCYRIVARHKATISVNTGATGTTISVSFPAPKN